MTELVAFIASFDPGFPASIRGATAAEIARLEAAAGHSLPKAHRELLAVAGHGLGDFLPCGEGRDFAIEQLIDWYELRSRKPPPKFTLIARDVDDTGLEVFLEEIPGIAPQVVELAADGPFLFEEEQHHYSILYESLPGMLFGMAFYQYQIVRKDHRVTLQMVGDVEDDPDACDERLRAFGEVAGHLEMSAVRHTGGWFPCYQRADAWACCYEPPLAAPFYRLAALSEREAFRLAEILADNLGLAITDR